jgi:hypothetical protein
VGKWRSLRELEGGNEIAKHAKSELLAFFRVELHGTEIAPSDTGGKFNPVITGRRDAFLLFGNGIIGMDKIEFGIVPQSLEKSIRGSADMELIPTHVRDFQLRSPWKMDHFALQYAEPFHSGGFLTGVKEQLIAKTDAEIGAIGSQPFLDKIPETGFTQLPGTISKGTDSRHHKGGTSPCIGC